MAIADDEVIKKLNEFREVITYDDNPFVNLFRKGMKWLIWSVAEIVKGLESTLTDVLNMLMFFSSTAIDNLIKEHIGLTFAIGALAMGIFFIKYMKQDGPPLKNLIYQLIFGLGVFALLGTVMNVMAWYTNDLSKYALDTQNGMVDKIISENIIDLKIYDEANWDASKIPEEKNNISTDMMFYFNPAEHLEKSDVSSESTEIMTSKWITLNGDGEAELSKMPKGVFKYDTMLFRYKWHPWRMLTRIALYGMVIFFFIFKLVKLEYELGFNRIVGAFVALSDLEQGQKIKTVIQSIVSAFVTIILCCYNLRVMFLFYDYIDTWNLSFISQLFLYIGVSMVAIDGPYIIQQLTGVDAGLRSSGNNLATGMNMLKGLGGSSLGVATAALAPSATKKGLRKTKELGEKVAEKGAGLFGAVAGAVEGFKGESLDDEMAKQEKNNDDLNSNDKDSIDNVNSQPGEGKDNLDKNVGTNIENQSGSSLSDEMEDNSKDGRSEYPNNDFESLDEELSGVSEETKESPDNTYVNENQFTPLAEDQDFQSNSVRSSDSLQDEMNGKSIQQGSTPDNIFERSKASKASKNNLNMPKSIQMPNNLVSPEASAKLKEDTGQNIRNEKPLQQQMKDKVSDVQMAYSQKVREKRQPYKEKFEKNKSAVSNSVKQLRNRGKSDE